MPKYNIIKDGEVINTILWDGISDYNPGEGCTLELWTPPVIEEEVE